jgi:hypothetical protein
LRTALWSDRLVRKSVCYTAPLPLYDLFCVLSWIDSSGYGAVSQSTVGAEEDIYTACRSVSGAGYPRIRSIATTWPL